MRYLKFIEAVSKIQKPEHDGVCISADYLADVFDAVLDEIEKPTSNMHKAFYDELQALGQDLVPQPIALDRGFAAMIRAVREGK